MWRGLYILTGPFIQDDWTGNSFVWLAAGLSLTCHFEMPGCRFNCAHDWPQCLSPFASYTANRIHIRSYYTRQSRNTGEWDVPVSWQNNIISLLFRRYSWLMEHTSLSLKEFYVTDYLRFTGIVSINILCLSSLSINQSVREKNNIKGSSIFGTLHYLELSLHVSLYEYF